MKILLHILGFILSIIFLSSVSFAQTKSLGWTYYLDASGAIMTTNFRGLGDINLYWGDIVVGWVDKKTFKVMKNIYARDKNHVYIQGTAMIWVDQKSFKVTGMNFSKDKSHIYWLDTELVGADIKTFKPVSFMFWKDKNAVYYYGKKIEWADPKTFSVVFDAHGNAPSFSKDKNAVYQDGDKTSFDPKTYKHKYVYSMDKNKVVCISQYTQEIVWVNIQTFVPLSDNYAKDKYFVYRDCIKVEGVSPKTFKLPKQ